MSNPYRATSHDYPARDVYTVSRLNLETRDLLEATFSTVWVEGEIANVARPRSGHLYFSLRDTDCQVRCAMFRMHNRGLAFEPENGLHVLAGAKVSLYPDRGEFQLIVHYLEEAGTGALRRAFDAMKNRLHAEGLFDPQHKLPIPTLPRRIGIITSPTGAAVHDVLSVLERRFPAVPVILYPVAVQGIGAAQEIADTIDRAVKHATCDVLILTRGGGSLEDLWAFNEEVVARAIYRAQIPIVAGVGHEIDITITDWVADLRAPTPSAAAESVVPDASEWAARFREFEARLIAAARRGAAMRRATVSRLARRLVHPRQRLFDRAQRLDTLTLRLSRTVHLSVRERRTRLFTLTAQFQRHTPDRVIHTHRARCETLNHRLRRAMRAVLTEHQARVRILERALGAFGPQATLERGYAILLCPDGTIVREAPQVRRGEHLRARLARGALGLEVMTIEPES